MCKFQKVEDLSLFGRLYHRASDVRNAISPYANGIIYYGWIPFVIYAGLKHGTHKYMDPEKGQMPQSRPAKWSDLIPILGTHGLPNAK